VVTSPRIFGETWSAERRFLALIRSWPWLKDSALPHAFSCLSNEKKTNGIFESESKVFSIDLLLSSSN